MTPFIASCRQQQERTKNASSLVQAVQPAGLYCDRMVSITRILVWILTALADLSHTPRSYLLYLCAHDAFESVN
jgi:hypothetical protein